MASKFRIFKLEKKGIGVHIIEEVIILIPINQRIIYDTYDDAEINLKAHIQNEPKESSEKEYTILKIYKNK